LTGIGSSDKLRVELLLCPRVRLEGRHIVLVEDIVDTGLTIASLLRGLENFRPASVKIATLFVKPEALKEDFEIHYRGFDIPNKFIVGYGLDYEGFGRNYRDVYCLAED
jgi:hypoxanthine phosphoribosyltransferase